MRVLEACIEGKGQIRGWSRAFLGSSLHVTGARTEEVFQVGLEEGLVPSRRVLDALL